VRGWIKLGLSVAPHQSSASRPSERIFAVERGVFSGGRDRSAPRGPQIRVQPGLAGL